VGGAAGTNTSIYGQVLTVMLAGSSASSSLGDAILITPTGDNDADLATAMSHMTISPEATLQATIQVINAFLNGLSTWGSTTTQERIGDIFSQIDGTIDYSGNISSKLTTRIQLIRSSGTQLSSVISDVADSVGGSASDLYGNVGAANLGLGGSGVTTIAKIGSLGSASSLFAMIGVTSLADLAAALGNTGTGNSTIAALLKSGTGTSLYALIVGSSGILSQIDGTTTDSGNIAGKLTTQIQVIRSSGTQLSTAISAVATILGGTNSDLYSNVGAVNSSLGGSGVTTLAKIGSLGSASSLFSMIGVTSLANLTAALGNTGAGNSAIAALLNGSIGTSLYALLVGSSGILNQIDGTTTDSGNVSGKLTTQIQALNSSATQLSTAISAANSSLGGSGTTITRINSANATLDGVRSLSGLSSFTVSTAATNSSGTISIMGNDGSAGRSYSVDTSAGGINLGDGTGGTAPIANGATITLTHSDSGNTITFVNNSGSSITSASSLATYLANAYPVSAIIKANTNTKATALKSFLGGAGYSAMSNAVAIINSLLTSSTGVVVTDLATVRALFVISLGANLQADAQTLNTLLDGTATGSTVQARIGSPTLGGSASNLVAIFGGTSTNLATQAGDPGASNTIIGNIGGSTTSVQDALNANSIILFGNSSFSSPLYTQVSNMSTNLDNSLSLLPGGSVYATIGTVAASDGSGGVNIIVNSGLGSANGTYKLQPGDISSGLPTGVVPLD